MAHSVVDSQLNKSNTHQASKHTRHHCHNFRRFSEESRENTLCRAIETSTSPGMHLLHYLVKVEGKKCAAICTADTIYCCHISVSWHFNFITSYMLQIFICFTSISSLKDP